MITPRFLTILQKTYVVRFGQDRATRDALRIYQSRAFSLSNVKSIREKIQDDNTKKPRPKTVPVPKITLQSPDNSIIVTVLEDAQRMAKRRNLILVKVSDPDGKTQRALYKLMSNSSLNEDIEEIVKDTDSKATQKFKPTKVLYICTKITEYDLRVKVKNVIKLLNKRHKVKFVITLDGVKENTVRDIIEEDVKNHGTIQQIPSKKNVVMLLITPLLNESTNSCINNKKETV